MLAKAMVMRMLITVIAGENENVFIGINDEDTSVGQDLFRISNQLSLDSYMDNFLMLVFMMGIIFELPLVSMFLGKVGLLNRSFFREYRRHAIGHSQASPASCRCQLLLRNHYYLKSLSCCLPQSFVRYFDTVVVWSLDDFDTTE